MSIEPNQPRHLLCGRLRDIEPSAADEPPTQAGSWGTGPDVDPLHDPDGSFTNAVVVAIGEFASSLAGSYPECPTGDIAPDVDETFYAAAKRFATEWIKANHPTHNEHPFTVVGMFDGEPWVQHVMARNAQAARDQLIAESGEDDIAAVFPGHIKEATA
jgi:hypothetical protein